jgi:hypothetical protein
MPANESISSLTLQQQALDYAKTAFLTEDGGNANI